jgi:sigma-B regulation protein RsbU (phosphoserine phosphatase)
MKTTLGYIDNAPCGFLCFTDTGIITVANQTLAAILGYESNEEIIGQNIENILPVAGRIFYQTHLFPMLKLHGKADEIFLSLKHKNKENLSVMCNAIRHEGENGSDSINECILIPITVRSKYEKELLHAKKKAEETLEKNEALMQTKKELEAYSIELDRKVGRLGQLNSDLLQFSKIISHDLKEHIRRIAIYADKVNIQDKGTMSPKSTNDLESIRNECIRLSDLSINLDKYMNLNLLALKIEKIDLTETIQKSLARLDTGSMVLDLVMQGERLPDIEGFKDQIESLFYYLLQSALHLHEREDSLSVIVEGSVIQQNSFKSTKDKYRYVDYARITFTDDGERTDRKKIQSLFTIEKTTDIRSSGLGFGLAFCKKIVDNHYGTITIEPNKGKGNVVTLLLPVEQWQTQ